MILFRHLQRIKERDPDAVRALEDAQQALAERRSETAHIKAMTRGWRRIREHNHLAEALNESFRGRRA